MSLERSEYYPKSKYGSAYDQWYWWYYPAPSEGWGRRGTPQRPNSRTTPQVLNQKSRTESGVVDLRRGSETEQSQRRCLNSYKGCPKALQEKLSRVDRRPLLKWKMWVHFPVGLNQKL